VSARETFARYPKDKGSAETPWVLDSYSYYNIYTRQYRTFEEAYADAIEPTESGEKRSASYPFRIYKWRP